MDLGYYSQQQNPEPEHTNIAKLIDTGFGIAISLYTVVAPILLTIYWYNNIFASWLLLAGIITNIIIILHIIYVMKYNQQYKLTIRQKVTRYCMLAPMIGWTLGYIMTSMNDKSPAPIIIIVVVYATLTIGYTLYWICYTLAICCCCKDEDFTEQYSPI
jgi:hypothetical protein